MIRRILNLIRRWRRRRRDFVFPKDVDGQVYEVTVSKLITKDPTP